MSETLYPKNNNARVNKNKPLIYTGDLLFSKITNDIYLCSQNMTPKQIDKNGVKAISLDNLRFVNLISSSSKMNLWWECYRNGKNICLKIP